eukprot:g49385.t1
MTLDKVLEEILSTEESYTRGLSVIEDCYAPKMKVMVTPEQHRTLFDFLQAIRNCNQEFLKQIQGEAKMRDEPAYLILQRNIVRSFREFAPFFKMYSDYASNYEQSLELLRTLRARPDMQRFLSEQEEATREKLGRHQRLEDLLISPVQRVPRYKLLLDEALKRADKSCVEYGELEAALELIKSAAQHMNQETLKEQARSRVREIQEQCVPFPDQPLVTPGRRLVREGPLTKCTRHLKQEKVYFYLFTDPGLLLYVKDQLLVPNLISPLKDQRQIVIDRHFVLEELDASMYARGGVVPDWTRTAFVVKSPAKSSILIAPDADTMAAWMADIEQVAQAARKSITGNHANEAVIPAKPVWQPDSSSDACSVCNRKFTLVFRRHHCRVCGKLVCENDSKWVVLPKPNFELKHGSGRAVEERTCPTCKEQVQSMSPGSHATGKQHEAGDLMEDSSRSSSSDALIASSTLSTSNSSNSSFSTLADTPRKGSSTSPSAPSHTVVHCAPAQSRLTEMQARINIWLGGQGANGSGAANAIPSPATAASDTVERKERAAAVAAAAAAAAAAKAKAKEAATAATTAAAAAVCPQQCAHSHEGKEQQQQQPQQEAGKKKKKKKKQQNAHQSAQNRQHKDSKQASNKNNKKNSKSDGVEMGGKVQALIHTWSQDQGDRQVYVQTRRQEQGEQQPWVLHMGGKRANLNNWKQTRAEQAPKQAPRSLV